MAKYFDKLSKEEQEEILRQLKKQREEDELAELMGERLEVGECESYNQLNTNKEVNKMVKQEEMPTFEQTDKREATFHNFDEKPEIAGKLKTIQVGEYGEQYVVETPLGDITLGTYDVLKSKIKQADIGKWLKIKFIGLKQSTKDKRRNYKDFEVYVKEPMKTEKIA